MKEAALEVVVAQSRALETPSDFTEKKVESRQEEPQAAAMATTNLNSAKAEAKLVKALDYLVAISDNSDNPAQKWVINESLLASLTGCLRPAIKKFFETHRSFINQANNTHGKEARRAIPRFTKNHLSVFLGYRTFGGSSKSTSMGS